MIFKKTNTLPRPSWQTALANGTLVSAILLGGANFGAAQSQPIADDTLGSERSVVVPLGSNTPGDRIRGGARRGDNLFHSFQQFNVNTGRGVYFSDPGVNNIITRVTGGTGTQIDGILGVLGNANLFLINPNGIIFGANARLDVSGGFTATTADAIEFNNQGNFSATNPTAVPLLTVQPSAFLFNQINPAPITNNSIVSNQANPSTLPGFGLQVLGGNNLTLLGGNISMSGGGVNALGGQVEIGGLGAPGKVTLNADGSLTFPTGIALSDVLLTNLSVIDVAADGGGSITINASNFEISNSVLFAGIGRNSGFVGAQAGDITLNANAIAGKDSSIIYNLIGVGGIGNAGDIRITADSLLLANETRLATSTQGQGNAGNAIINVRDLVTLDNSNILSTVGSTDLDTIAVGDGGDIRITTASLSLLNGAQLLASTFGQGNAGDVIIDTQERVFIDGLNLTDPSFASAIFSSSGALETNEFAGGDGGDIRITTGSLLLTNGAQLVASTFGQGNAGNVIIDVRDRVTLDNASTIFSTVEFGNSGTIAVGNGGNIRISASSLSLINGSQLLTSSSGQGNAGDVIVKVRDRINLDGVNPTDPRFSTAIYSGVGSSNTNTLAVGDGGNIQITTNLLSLTNGAQLAASTFGQGNAGNVIINVRDLVSLDGVSPLGLPSAINSSVGDTNANAVAYGDGGDIRITTGSLSLTNGAQLQALTLSRGNAGNAIIQARDRVTLQGVNWQGFPSGIFTATLAGAEGRGGDVSIAADSIRLVDGAVVSTETLNAFSGGTVTLKSNSFEAIGGGQVITATSSSGDAGNITLNVANGITLSGFNPNYNALESPLFGTTLGDQGAASGLYASTAPNSSGVGGTIQITTDKLEVFDRATIAVNSQGEGRAGNIDITANRVQLNDFSRLSAETNTVDGGNITLSDVELLQLGNSSLISTTAGTAKAGGNGGNIDIDSDLIVAFPNENSDIRANAFTGSGGNVRIDSQGLFGIAFQAQDNPLTSDITASSEQGLQGNVNITLPEIDPRRDLTQLPQETADVSSRIAQGCRSSNGARQDRSQFIVKGRGGLPPSPTDSLVGDESLATWVTLEQTSKQQTTTIPAPELRNPAAPIVEAQGWIVDRKGKLILIAAAPTNTARSHLICQRQENND